MPTKTYKDFSEIEQELQDNAPPIVYKYRTWADDNHKNVLIKNQLWLSHPFELNDPLDVRPDLVYSKTEIEDDAFYRKLRDSIPDNYSHLGETEKDELAKQQWQKIKADPDAHFNANRKEIVHTRERYDQYGILSTSSDCLNISTWKEYGDNHQGYSIGFNTVELARELKCTAGLVTYSDEPFPYSFLGKHEKFDILLYKKTSWEYEQEFRFITLGIGIHMKRLVTVSPEIVSEIVLGYQISAENEKEILQEIENRYPSSLPIYKTAMNADGILIKNRIR